MLNCVIHSVWCIYYIKMLDKTKKKKLIHCSEIGDEFTLCIMHGTKLNAQTKIIAEKL